jgi:predicted MFS family arabinose efflux permease
MNPAFFALAAAAFVSGANLRLFDALLPTVARDFGVLPTTASVVITAFTLAYGLFQVVHGPLGDRLGKLRVVGVATLIAAAASFGCSFASSLETLTILRFATGIGAAAIVPLSLAWVGDNTPYDRRQAAIGRLLSFILMGQILGPALGGALAEFVDWRRVFDVLAAIFLIVSVVLLAVDRRAARPKGMAGTGSIVDNYLRVLRDPWVRTVMLTVFLEGGLFYGAFAYTGAYLKERFDLSYLLIGGLLAGFGLGGVIYSVMVRWLLVRFGETGFVKIRLLHVSQHAADQGHRDGAAGAGHRDRRIRLCPVHGTGQWGRRLRCPDPPGSLRLDFRNDGPVPGHPRLVVRCPRRKTPPGSLKIRARPVHRAGGRSMIDCNGVRRLQTATPCRMDASGVDSKGDKKMKQLLAAWALLGLAVTAQAFAAGQVAEAKLGKGIVDRRISEEASSFAVRDRAYLWVRVEDTNDEMLTVTWKVNEMAFPVDLRINGSPWHTWASKTLHLVGDWTVTVTDSAGKTLHESRFKVR